MITEEKIISFLKKCSWQNASQTFFAADLSTRLYRRLEQNNASTILMIADESQKPALFVELADVLRACGISAPHIIAQDVSNGLVLMEDYGNDNGGRLLDEGCAAWPIYQQGLDVLVHLHKNFKSEMVSALNLPIYNAELFATLAALFLDHYYPYKKGMQADQHTREKFHQIWLEALKPVEFMPQSLLLRDYMPDNLMMLSGRKGVQNVGVLDFQDAGLGSIAYDVASLAECVRRDQADDYLEKLIKLYHNANPVVSYEEWHNSCVLLAAQRNTRTLGNIARRPEKRSFLPRMEKTMQKLLQDKCLSSVAAWFEAEGFFAEGVFNE